jgi:hypothetical protein
MTGDGTTAQIVLIGPTGAILRARSVTDQGRPDLRLVDTLARWLLLARRIGGYIELRAKDEELRLLLDLVGLAGLIRRSGEVGREPEGREEMFGVEKGVETRHPVPGDLQDLKSPGPVTAVRIHPVLAEGGTPVRRRGHET